MLDFTNYHDDLEEILQLFNETVHTFMSIRIFKDRGLQQP